ncbi:NYN domain-containing protein [Methylotuvimicrobium buryatense]|uniref:NYN domain-containing protein n=1 Tax=Methylotuvimicrobium buryatense TaxID=95641 RepID=A0A4P9UTE1_METBY|nr:NYN domain-containing protein [Methylotuvimicrobium buryatense]QCW83833.1 NYN domain-containing protein [Methylotuvimicrobium buryatense]
MMSEGDVDAIEILYTIRKRVPEAAATVAEQIDRKRYALEILGAKTIVCPAKRMQGGGFKQSDDQLLQIKTLSICMRLKPDFLTLVSGDDHASLVWELREHGIRTEVVASVDMLGSQLRRACYAKIDLDQVFQKLQEEIAGIDARRLFDEDGQLSEFIGRILVVFLASWRNRSSWHLRRC